MKRNIIFAVILYFLIYSVFAEPSVNSAALNHFNRGLEYYNNNDFNSAIIEFTNAIDIFPEYADAYLERGNSYDNKGDDVNALKNYLQAGKFNENYLLFAYGYECAGSVVKDFDEAIIILSKCIELKINSFIAYCMRGNSYGAKEDYKTAINDYNEAIKINPNIFQPYFSRGSMNIELRNFEQAIFDYEMSIKLCPDYYLAYFILSFLYSLTGNYNKAEEMMMIFNLNSEKANI